MKKLLTHLLGPLLILSTIYHSQTLYSFIAIVPFLLVSYAVEQERLVFPSLILATMISTIFISSGSMNEIFSLLFFSLTFALPLFFYWLINLSKEPRFKPVTIALSFVLFTSLLFYLLPEMLDITEFVLSPGNRLPQILMFFGSGMIIAIPYHVLLSLKS